MTKDDIRTILETVRAKFETDVNITISARGDAKDISEYEEALEKLPLHCLELIDQLMVERDDLPDPPDSGLIGDMFDVFGVEHG